MDILKLNFYIVIQTCLGYERALQNLLFELNKNKITRDIIIVENKNNVDEIIFDECITTIKTKKNNFELTMFGKIHEFLNKFKNHDLFLFLHDTIELTDQFYNKIEKLNEEIKKYNLDFDFIPLADNFQSAQGFATRKFIEQKFHVFNQTENISKPEAIQWEWGYGKYGDISMRNISNKTKFIENSFAKKIEEQSNFLNSEHKRVKLYLNSIGINKYYYVHSDQTPHPNEL